MGAPHDPILILMVITSQELNLQIPQIHACVDRISNARTLEGVEWDIQFLCLDWMSLLYPWGQRECIDMLRLHNIW